MNESSRRTEKDIKKYENILAISQLAQSKIKDNITEMTSKLTPGFLCGLIDGDGSFNIAFLKDQKILPQFTLCFGPNCLPLYEKSKKYLGESGVLEKTNSILILRIRNLDSILNNIIPLIDSNLIHTEKMEFYKIWKEVCFILKNEKSQISDSSIKKIVELAYNMNKGGKRRKLTKEEYLNQLGIVNED